MIKKSFTKKNKRLYLFLELFGLILIIAGLLAGYYNFSNERIVGFCSGIGSAAIALGFVGLLSLKRNPEQARQQDINDNDERLIRIREKSAYTMFFVTLLVLVIAEFTFVWLDYIIPGFIVIGMMAVHVIGYFTLLYQNNKKM